MVPQFRDQEGLPDYWGIETFTGAYEHQSNSFNGPNQEGLPDYWGIETCAIAFNRYLRWHSSKIRKDYPTTGVLKLQWQCRTFHIRDRYDQEGLPDYWGIETLWKSDARVINVLVADQEGLPDYWGIETNPKLAFAILDIILAYQEGLPDYWGIET